MFIIILLTVKYVEKPPVSYVVFMLNIDFQLISDTEFLQPKNIQPHKSRRAAVFLTFFSRPIDSFS